MATLVSRISEPFRSQSVALVLCYAVGFIGARLMGEGAPGAPLLAIAAPAAAGLLIRQGARLGAGDALRLLAAHLVLASVFGDPVAAAAWGAAEAVVYVGAAALAFYGARRLGLIRSPVSLMGALAAVAAVAPLAPALLAAVRLVVEGGASPWSLGAAYAVDALSMALVLAISITQGRGLFPTTAESGYTEERRPGLWEYASAGALALALVWVSLDVNRTETTLAGSVALLWFALRLGLFPTTIAAFVFAVVHLRFGGSAVGFETLAHGDPHLAEAIRYALLTFFTAPSVVVATVVYDQQRLKRMFAYRAMHDGLTGLMNRSRFMEVLDAAAQEAGAGKRRFLLLLVDLDHFKSINDTYGHAHGDKLLIVASTRLKGSMRSTDVVARLGGDEFAVLAPVRASDDAMRLARRLVENMHEDCALEGVTVRPSVTVGGVLAPDSTVDPQRLMQLADEALYKAKKAGRNCWRFADASLDGLARTPSASWRNAEEDLPAEVVFID